MAGMNIVMNEAAYAERILEEKRIGAHPSETLFRLARYYMHKGKNAAETRSLLESYVLSCDGSSSLVVMSDRIDAAVKFAAKYPMVIIEKISVTQKELDTIGALDGVQIQRLAFALLCIAKYHHACNSENKYWIHNRDSEIMKMANINTSIKRQSLMFSRLRDAGMIRFSNKVDDLGIQVLFADDGQSVLDITDMRNVGYQYMKHIGGGYCVCTNCGITFSGKRKNTAGRAPKYCPECAVKIKTKQQVEAVMRRRGNLSKEKPA